MKDMKILGKALKIGMNKLKEDGELE